MQSKAEDFLVEGRRSEAAALFDFALSQQPDDPEAMNNLAFCLLPDDSAAALVHLRRARALGYAPLSINLYNEATALVAQGHERQALQAVEDHWDAVCASPRTGGTLWEIQAGGAFVLVQKADVGAALLVMCLELARAQGGPAADRWGGARRRLMSAPVEELPLGSSRWCPFRCGRRMADGAAPKPA